MPRDRPRPSGIIELPVDWSLDDWPYFQLDWSRLRALERLVEHIKSGGDAWFATLGAVGEHVREMEDQREAAQAASKRGA